MMATLDACAALPSCLFPSSVDVSGQVGNMPRGARFWLPEERYIWPNAYTTPLQALADAFKVCPCPRHRCTKWDECMQGAFVVYTMRVWLPRNHVESCSASPDALAPCVQVRA